jgi:hypothetical protein
MNDSMPQEAITPAPPPLSSAVSAPPCPRCKVPLDGIEEAGEGVCGDCATVFQYTLFPAHRRTRPVARAVRSIEGDATCYFHAQNQAASVCDDCGRYLCAVCEVIEDQSRLCPPCIATRRKKVTQKADELVAYDSIALTLAVLPVVLWPITLVTAPATLGVVIFGWKKPRSLVRPGAGRFVLAVIVALIEIVVWAVFGGMLWLGA